MDALDIVIIILLLADIVRGARIGFSRQFFSFAGFWGGLFLAALLAPVVTHYTTSTTTRLAIILTITLVVVVALSSLGEFLGIKLAHLAHHFKVGLLDRGLGGVFGAVLVGLSVWILTAMFLNLPSNTISQEIQQSRIVRLVDGVLPPAPSFIARIQRLIDPNGFPQVFLGPEPKAGAVDGVATTAEANRAIAADSAATVKIQGFGCGAEISGSGFIVAPGIVVTNAHVVAGISRPLVLDRNGIHPATALLFDPNLDLAVLRVPGLTTAPLTLTNSTVADGSHSIVLGYPGGGPFTASPGAVIQSYLATGRNIYDEGITARTIYEIDAVVQPGNSGGPLVLPDGTVIGVVFARSQVNDSVGYALTSGSISSDVHKGESSKTAVSTGACAAN